jgi:hypothetical protein
VQPAGCTPAVGAAAAAAGAGTAASQKVNADQVRHFAACCYSISWISASCLVQTGQSIHTSFRVATACARMLC